MKTAQQANRLRVLRAERRLTQLSLARMAKVNATKISFIENGLVEPTDQERARIAKALKVSEPEAFPQLAESVAS